MITIGKELFTSLALYSFIKNFRLCKEEIQAEAKALAETANSSAESKKLKNLEKNLADKRVEKEAKRVAYEAELATLPAIFPEMEEQLRGVLTKLQLLEKQRMAYIKVTIYVSSNLIS